MKKFAILNFFIFFVTFSAYALEEKQKNIANEIFLHAEQSIDRIEDGKIFLKPDKIYFLHNHIFIETDNGEGIPVPNISSDGHDIFLTNKCGKMRWRKMLRCTKCQWECEEIDLPEKCIRCGNDTFTFSRYVFMDPESTLCDID